MTLYVRFGVSLVFTTASVALSANTTFAQCKYPNLPYSPMTAVVAQGGSLASDGRGAYTDGLQSSTVNLVNAANLVMNDGAAINRNSRYLTFTFNTPVAGDPLATALGVIQDRHGEVHVYYKLDPVGADGLRQKHSLEELPDDGVFNVSERTDIFVNIGGVRHLLMFGGDTWPINTCRPDDGAIFGAPGSTFVQIARTGNSYTLQAPPGSVGRLFDYSNSFAPVDKGLYRFSFVVTLAPKTTTKGK
jgi:hypothetical protein